MDIMLGETQKKLIRLAVRLLRRKLGKCATQGNLHNDMINCGNPGIARIHRTVEKWAKQLNSDFQRETTLELSELGLWILYKDTAYRDVFFCILADLLIHSDELLEEIKPYVKHPDKWYTNNWVKSKEKSKKLKDSGEIPPYAKSLEESIYTPSEQNKRLKKIK